MPDFGIFRGFNEKLFGDKLVAGQLPTQLGLIGSQDATGIDSDYQAILDYAIAQGYTLPSSGQQALQNQLVVDLKDAGVWSKLDIFYVFATDGDSDFASINWKDPNNFEVTEINSPTFTSNEGFASDGSSSYLNTNFSDTDLINSSINNMSIGFWEFNTPFSNSVFIGRADNLILNQTFGGGDGFIRINERGSSRPSNTTYSNGLVIGNRTSSSNLEFYSPNKTKIIYSQNSSGLFDDNVHALNYGSVYSSAGCKISILFLSASFNTTEIDNFYLSTNSYISSI